MSSATRTIRVFSFLPDVAMEDVESATVLATLAAEALHGRAQVRLNGRFVIDSRTKQVHVTDAGSVSESFCAVLTVLASQMLGEDSFCVETQTVSSEPS